MQLKENDIIQSARLYIYMSGNMGGKLRWIKTARIFEKMGLTWKAKRIYLDDEEIKSLEGKPISEWPEPSYKVGSEKLVWCVPLECDFQHIVDAGFTAIQTYGPYWQPNHGRDFLDKAHNHGLKVLYSAKSHVHDLLRQGKNWDKDTCKWMVDEFDSHPALWAWIYFDEPDAGDDSPKHLVPMELQREIHNAFRSWTDKPLTTVVRGGTRGWHLVDFSLFDFIMADSYVIDGNPCIWDWEPCITWRDALHIVGQQEREYLDTHMPDMPFMFVFQSSDAVAIAAGNYGTRIPECKIQEQFDILNQYQLFSAGVAMYPWSGGDFDPMKEKSLRLEIKKLFEKINKEV
jgi:hypothetical protein